VDSALGEGATFSVLLPVAYEGVAQPLEARHETLDLPAEGGSRVLVVEDDPTAYETIAGHLAASGYIPVRAHDAPEALHLAEVLQPAAITLDIILPGEDGWDVLRKLKERSETADIPVVVVSMLDNRELAVTLGAAEYLVKPVDGERLIAILCDLVRPVDPRDVNVLLVDDDPDVHELVRTRLEPLGYGVIDVLSGPEALDVARRRRPDVILLDLMMDGMDGFEVNTRLKADPVTADIPVVVLTAKDMTAEDRRRLRGSIEALVSKGEGHSRLIAAIDASIRRRRGPHAAPG
jgi:CheY-like chemotaxis protein